MRRAASFLAIAGVIFVFSLVENDFHRPKLSQRPALGFARSAEWNFEMFAEEIAITEGSRDGQVKVRLSGLSPSANRKKNGNDVNFVPIPTDVLITTLNDAGLAKSSLSIRFIAKNQSEVSLEIIRSESISISDLVLEVIGFTRGIGFSNESKLGTNVQIEIHTKVTGCDSRESRVHCPLVDFSSVDLSSDDFDRANLRGADLTSANLDDAKVGGADLSGAILKGTSMRRAWLVGTDFSGAFMENIDFSDAIWTD